ncbi:hypothetical protein MMT22_29515, partial [Escherichia coli]|nr:hypothetical protein [Escherichia coli]
DLLLDNKADRLLKADAATLLALLTSDDAPTDDVLSAEFVVRNGLIVIHRHTHQHGCRFAVHIKSICRTAYRNCATQIAFGAI